MAWFCWLAVALNASAQDTDSRPLGPTKRVLIVFSENRESTGNAMMEQAMRAEMARVCTNQLEFFDESFDASRFLNTDHARVFRESLRQKYASLGLDLVVAFMSRDFNLTNELPEQMFAKIPVIFVAVSEVEIPETLRRPGFTGIFQRHDISGTLSLMFRLQPEIHRVIVVGGVSMVDHLLMNRITAAAQNLDGVEFELWTNRPLAQMAEGLTNLPPGTAILLSTVQRDVANQPYYSSLVAQQVMPTASAPVYALSSGLVGTGVVGGAVVDNESLGIRAGELAVLRLQGGTNQFPVEVRTVGTPMVDWRALQRWGIPQSRLPANCLVKYQPPASIWQEHKGVILSTAGVLFAQAITIAGLLINRRYRQQAEARARVNQEARALVAAIVESSDDAIIRKDLEGNIMTWNRSAERLFGYAAFEVMGKSITIIVPAALLGEESHIRERSRLGEPIHSFETERLHKDSRIIQVSIAISPIFEQSGQVVGASQTCRDISSLKAAEMEIRQQREELAHVTRVSTLGQLTSAITHELNQPLGAILRNAEAAEMFLQSDQPDLNEVRAILADIRKDDQRAGNVIARMRSLLKRRSLVADPLDVREVVEDTVALVRPDLLTRQVKLTLEIPEHVPMLLGDRVHLQQVLLNLILNGMDAMSTIPGEERELKVRISKDIAHLEVSVSDCGTGLPPSESGRLFEAFYTTKPNGMGMGLAISRTIIEAHGGKIRAENNPGKGATFTLSLPATEVEI
jgi:PAS domain S-box-containing protein